MLFNSTSNSMAAQVAMVGRVHRMDSLKQLLDDAKKWKPLGYDAEVAKRRDYYSGHQLKHALSELRRRYPNTHTKMTPYTAPIFKHLVEQQSSIYRAAPRREWTADTQQLNEMYSDSSVNAALWKAEQISAAARLAFIRVGWDDIDERAELTPYWPDQVFVACDPDRPTKLEAAYVLIAIIASEDGVNEQPGTRQRYESWIRRDNGWARSIIVGDGSTWTNEVEEEVFPILPWVAVPFEGFSGELYQMPPADDIAVNQAVDSLYSSLLYTIAMQSHTQLTYSGPAPEHDLVGGPGTVWNAGEGGVFDSIAYTPQIAAVNTVADDIVKRLLTLRGVSPAAATADPAYMAAVAIKVLNQPMMERREARAHVWRDIEERRLWPILAAMMGSSASNKLKWYAGDIQLSLDEQVEFRLAQGRVQTNVSTWPKEMVVLGIAADIEDAQRQYEENIAANKDNNQNYLVPFIKGASIAPAPEEPFGTEPDGQV